MTEVRQEVDRVAAEIHRKALENVVNEMAITLRRTSGSPIVTDSLDFCTCLLDAEGEQLALSAHVLNHSASSVLGTARIIRDLRDRGDVPLSGEGWIVNDPYDGGAMHQGDVGVVMPMFFGQELVGWGFANLHVLDIGGGGVSGMNPGAHTVYDEGLRFPAVKIISGGQIEPAWEQLITCNVRVPRPVVNDIRSMIAANNVAQRKLVEVIERFGLDAHREYCELNKDLTEALFRERISRMPDGVYEAVDFIEFDGHGVDRLFEVRGTLEIEGDSMTFAFTGDPQTDAYINATVASARGCVMTMILTTLAYGDLPFNAGMWRPLTIDLGEPGTVVNAVSPAPVSLAHADGGMRIGKVAKNLLSQALSLSDDPVLAARTAGIPAEGGGSAGLFGHDAEGRPRVIFWADSGVGLGGPAQSFADGQDLYGISMLCGSGLPDVEVHEAHDPVLIHWRRPTPNSGGPGLFRGGLGLDQAYSIWSVDGMTGFMQSRCAELPAPGVGGGFAAASAAQYPIRETGLDAALARGEHPTEASIGGRVEVIPNRVSRATLNRSDVLRAVNGGGSGLGDPLLRDPALVVEDLRNGDITPTHARRAYGVVLDTTGRGLDEKATEAERETIRSARIGGSPERVLRAPAQVGVSVRYTDGDWRCAYCDHAVCAGHEDWRLTGTIERIDEITEIFARYEMQVVPRREPPAIEVRQYFCPKCAGCLAVDVLPEGVTVRSPQLVPVAT
jgi:N-methylhydantoinase B